MHSELNSMSASSPDGSHRYCLSFIEAAESTRNHERLMSWSGSAALTRANSECAGTLKAGDRESPAAWYSSRPLAQSARSVLPHVVQQPGGAASIHALAAEHPQAAAVVGPGGLRVTRARGAPGARHAQGSIDARTVLERRSI